MNLGNKKNYTIWLSYHNFTVKFENSVFYFFEPVFDFKSVSNPGIQKDKRTRLEIPLLSNFNDGE